MIICFSCSPETKTVLDQLVLTGGYRDHSDAISAAITNLAVIHAEMKNATAVVIDSGSTTTELGARRSQTPVGASEHMPQGLPTPGRMGSPPQAKVEKALAIPAMFAMSAMDVGEIPIAPIEEDAFPGARTVPIDDWIFGQFNRLLPVKVTCRALINLSADPGFRAPLDRVAIDIANEAAFLSRHLAKLDQIRHLPRDESLSVAFPKFASPDAFKSIQRFATQFVGSMTRGGRLLGLPASLKLIAKHPQDGGRIALTEAGLVFGQMENPLLDGFYSEGLPKFTDQEIDFLLGHIRRAVRAESFAFTIILAAVRAGRTTPDELDRSLTSLSAQDRETSEAFISTQRSGAISRMADLDLIERNRNANRVSYAITPKGQTFLSAAGA